MAKISPLRVFREIREEMAHQDQKWPPGRALDQRTWLAVLTEEVGEVARATLEHDLESYREELIQVAAVCIQAIMSLDRSREAGGGTP